MPLSFLSVCYEQLLDKIYAYLHNGQQRRSRPLRNPAEKRPMSAQITDVSDGIITLKITGILRQSEMAAVQKQAVEIIDKQGRVGLLAVMENFEGWERGGDWNDFEFQISHGDDIARIALVADPQWETGAMAFSGAGFRKASVRFFPTLQLEQAKAWITASE